MHTLSRLLVVASFSLVSLIAAPGIAQAAEDDCPVGSKQKTEDGFTWCQPTICANETQCDPGETCRSVPLCMEVGTLTDAGLAGATKDGGKQRLAVTQRCAPDKTCPQKQTCSDLQRCVSKSAADKMGPAPTAASSSTPTTTEPAKKSCGCRVVGASSSSSSSREAILGFAALGLVLARRRRGGSRAT